MIRFDNFTPTKQNKLNSCNQSYQLCMDVCEREGAKTAENGTGLLESFKSEYDIICCR